MHEARLCSDGTARWVEICYRPTPLEEERPYWDRYFKLVKVQDAHDRRQCRKLAALRLFEDPPNLTVLRESGSAVHENNQPRFYCSAESSATARDVLVRQ